MNRRLLSTSVRLSVLAAACAWLPAAGPGPSPDALLEPDAAEVYLRANQVGYGPADPKVGVAFSKAALPDAFAVVDASSGAAVFEGKVRALPGETWGAFPHHAELDFTRLTRPGRYRLQLGAARSLPF